MKKYIRTTIGVYEIEIPSEENDYLVEDEKYIICKNGGIIKTSTPVLKRADTIEELCDEYVIFYGNTYHVTRKYEERDLKPQKIKYNLFTWGVKEYEIYGAIWIKGENGEPILKSIAKMNEKGELELI